jgi:8-oxoguanine deaminase
LSGLVNTHHHLNQTLFRSLPAAQITTSTLAESEVQDLVRTTQEASRAGRLIGLAELAMSGCTTVFDLSYLFKNGNTLDHQIGARKKIGVRFRAMRGSMSSGKSKGNFLRMIVSKDRGRGRG